jgi:hypothetical protein
MDAEDDGAERFRVGRWVSDEDGEPEPGPRAGENTLGRPFPWPEGIGGPEPDPVPEEPPEEPRIRLPAPEFEFNTVPVPLDEFSQERRYRGARRADGTRRNRHWPMAAALLVAVGVALAVLIVLVALPTRRVSLVPSNTAGAATSATAQPPPTASAGPSSPAPAPVATSPRVVLPPKPPSATPFRPITIEAEAPGNILTGTAWVQAYPGASGGKIVRNIGNWGGDAGPGTLTFPKVTVPANGVYQLTFFYVHLDNEAQRTMVISIVGVGTLSVTVTGNSTCCASKTIAVPLRAGANRITFGNPDNHAPSLDKIVVSML